MSECKIVLIGKNRNGTNRYWCVKHHAPAYDKNGKKLKECLSTFKDFKRNKPTLDIDPEKYQGGIALWGCALAVYDTTDFELEPGIHVHARKEAGKEKEIDKTYGIVNVKLRSDYVSFDDLSSISYLSSNILNQEMVYLECPNCGSPHLDKDWYAVNPHKRHLCSVCGRFFNVKTANIGNPIMKAKALFGDNQIHRDIVNPNRSLDILQKDFPYGVSIWGSNAAFLWTSPKKEEYGIHIHAFKEPGLKPTIDETFDQVTIDGIALDVEQIRLFMVQNTLPYLAGRIVSLKCPNCGESFFDEGESSYTPKSEHLCAKCGYLHKTRKKVISNPFIDTITELQSFTKLKLRNECISTFYPDLAGW